MEKINISKLEWLAGQWEGIQGNGIYHEEWAIINGKEIVGKAYMIKKGEITSFEKLKIHVEENKIFYVADVSQNPQPVSFEMTYYDESKFIFENHLHDFPKIITYEKKDNALLATIEAEEKGKVKKFEFDLKLVTR
ncbi:MAG: DUF6265 family protein [Ignavibacteria bacterium]